jgi:hypothetical protein
MSDEKNEKDDLAEVKSLEIEPLSDEDLEAVPGGVLDCTSCDSNRICTG